MDNETLANDSSLNEKRSESRPRWQLAKFIDPSLSVFQKLVWVEGQPQLRATKCSVDALDTVVKGEDEAVGFETNVLSDRNLLPMVAYLPQIELLGEFADNVRPVEFRFWKTFPGSVVRNLRSQANQTRS
jgi:hypothetical protein